MFHRKDIIVKTHCIVVLFISNRVWTIHHHQGQTSFIKSRFHASTATIIATTILTEPQRRFQSFQPTVSSCYSSLLSSSSTDSVSLRPLHHCCPRHDCDQLWQTLLTEYLISSSHSSDKKKTIFLLRCSQLSWNSVSIIPNTNVKQWKTLRTSLLLVRVVKWQEEGFFSFCEAADQLISDQIIWDLEKAWEGWSSVANKWKQSKPLFPSSRSITPSTNHFHTSR